jgi:hypothetical protein
MGRFETRWLAAPDNLSALAELSGIRASLIPASASSSPTCPARPSGLCLLRLPSVDSTVRFSTTASRDLALIAILAGALPTSRAADCAIGLFVGNTIISAGWSYVFLAMAAGKTAVAKG